MQRTSTPFYLCLTLIMASSVAVAKEGAAPLPGLSVNHNAPIEVTADGLEVFQEENRAVFTGHVVAVQGQVRLKSDRMNIFYRKPEKEEGAKKALDSNAMQKDAIQKIEVEGNVFLSTPEETASGANGVYDVENHQIVLNDNVVLTKGNNTLKGDHLTYNLETGKSVFNGGGVQTPDGKGGQRVRALFMPDNTKQQSQ